MLRLQGLLRMARTMLAIQFKYVAAERARPIIWLVSDFIGLLVFPILWLHLYGERDTLHGYSPQDIVTYFIVVSIVSVFVISHCNEKLEKEIKDGKLNLLIVQPISMYLHNYLREAGFKIAYGMPMLPALAVAVWLFQDYIVFPTHAFTWVLFFISLILGFSVSHLMSNMIGAIGFWLTESRGPAMVFGILFTLFSGRLAPLSFFPESLQLLASVLPYRLLVDFPANLYLGNLSTPEILQGFGLYAVWLVILGALHHVVWNRGLRVYDGYGI